MSLRLATMAAGLLLATALPASAVIVSEGITYTASSVNGDTTTLTALIHIENINGVLDTRDGRFGVQSFAFNNTGLLGSPLSGSSAGFTFFDGGLNSTGCNGTGDFFCFAANTTPVAPPLPAESQLNILFTLTVGSGDFLAWLASDPHFKINWVGTANNYDLVSLGGSGIGINPLCTVNCDVPETPLPGAVWLFGSVVAAYGSFMAWTRRRRQRLALA